MPYSSSEEVYKALVEESDEDWIYGLTSFAVFEEQRIEWVKHFEENKGCMPTKAQIARWYQQQPEEAIIRAKGIAENGLQAYAAEVLESVLEAERHDILESSVINEIRQNGRFLPQFGINVLGGIVSTLIFAMSLTILYYIVISDASLIKIGNSMIDQQTQEDTNGSQSGIQNSTK